MGGDTRTTSDFGGILQQWFLQWWYLQMNMILAMDGNEDDQEMIPGSIYMYVLKSHRANYEILKFSKYQLSSR